MEVFGTFFFFLREGVWNLDHGAGGHLIDL